MTNIYNASSYKNKIINLLLKNKNFIKLINPQPSKCEDIDIADVLIGGEWIINGEKYEEQGHVFDYDFVNDTTTEEKTFVFVDTNIDSVQNNTFTIFNLYICIFTSKNLVRINSLSKPTLEEVKEMGYESTDTFANRIDILCDIVDRILNGSDKFNSIGNIEPAPRGCLTTYCPNNKYYGKCLKYQVSNYNEGGDACGN